MLFKDIIVIAILVAIALSALIYMGKQKKQGNKCIGCPHGGKCNGSCGENK
jgi:hypothetical protein